MIDKAAELGVESIVMGMPHRGRLNILGNVVRKPLSHIFNEFQGGVRPDKEGGYTGSGIYLYDILVPSLACNATTSPVVEVLIKGTCRLS
jgi:2-oxoglutarate dehydrogenase E1 component